MAILAIVVAGYAVLMLRNGVQDWRGAVIIGFSLLLVACAGLLALIAMVRIWFNGFKGVGMAAQTLLLVGLILLLPGFYVVRGLSLPVLNDVTTDLETPPEFSRSRAVLAVREGRVPPGVDAATREKQRLGYPFIVPILLDQPAEEAFEMARKAAIAIGWQIIETSAPGGRSGAGRIEAIQRTTFLRFTDDITIRIRPRAEGTRIDVRSASRIGKHDFGANARRISRFAAEISAQESEK